MQANVAPTVHHKMHELNQHSRYFMRRGLSSLFGILRKDCNIVNSTIYLATMQPVFCVVVGG